MSRFVAGLIKTAMKTIYEYEEKKIRELNLEAIEKRRLMQTEQPGGYSTNNLDPNIPMLVALMNSLQHTSIEIQQEIPSHGFFYEIIHCFAGLGESARIYLVLQKTVGRLLAYFMKDFTHQDPRH